MMLLAVESIMNGSGGLLVALGVLALACPLLLNAVAALMIVKIKRDQRAPAEMKEAASAAHEEPSPKKEPEKAPETAPAPAEPEEQPSPKEEAETAPEEVQPEAAEAPSAEEPKAGLAVALAAGGAAVRYNKSFMAKLIQSPDDVKGWYSQLKNALLAHKKAASRLSWRADSINCGRKKLAKFAIRGKTLCLYLALDPAAFEGSKYKVEPAVGKCYASVPCLFKVRTPRRAKYAMELIAELAKQQELTPVERKEVDYRLPYESDEELAERGLATPKTGKTAYRNLPARKSKVPEGPSETVPTEPERLSETVNAEPEQPSETVPTEPEKAPEGPSEN